MTGVWVGYDRPRTIVASGYAAQIAVPLWTRFMLTATKDDKPEWFGAPSSIVGVEVDRLSGRRATAACRAAGGQVAFEYFAPGTEPIDLCPLHGFGAMHALVTAPSVPLGSPVSASQVVAYEQTQAPASSADQTIAAAAAPAGSTPTAPSVAKKRGFWGRLLGTGRNDKKPAN